MNKSLNVAPELDAMNELQMDIQGRAKATKHWTSKNKAIYQTQPDLIYNQANAIFSLVPMDHDCTY